MKQIVSHDPWTDITSKYPVEVLKHFKVSLTLQALVFSLQWRRNWWIGLSPIYLGLRENYPEFVENAGKFDVVVLEIECWRT
jgi:hypothetical protein